MSHPLDKLEYPPPKWDTFNARKLMRDNQITIESYREWCEMNKGKFSEPICIDDSSDDDPLPRYTPAASVRTPRLPSAPLNGGRNADIVDLTEDDGNLGRDNGTFTSPPSRHKGLSPRQSLANNRSDSQTDSPVTKPPSTPQSLTDRSKARSRSLRSPNGDKSPSQGTQSSHSSFRIPPNPEVFLPPLPEADANTRPTLKFPSASKSHKRDSPTAAKSPFRQSSDRFWNPQKDHHKAIPEKPVSASNNQSNAKVTPADVPAGTRDPARSPKRYEGNDWSTQFLRYFRAPLSSNDDDSYNSNKPVGQDSGPDSVNFGANDSNLDPPFALPSSIIGSLRQDNAPATTPTNVVETSAAKNGRLLTTEEISRDLERVCPFDLLGKPCPRDETRHAKYPCDANKICKRALDCRTDSCPAVHLLKTCKDLIQQGACRNQILCRLGHSRVLERKEAVGRLESHEWKIPYDSPIPRERNPEGLKRSKGAKHGEAGPETALPMQKLREKPGDEAKEGQITSSKPMNGLSEPVKSQTLGKSSSLSGKLGVAKLNAETFQSDEIAAPRKVGMVNHDVGSAHAPWNTLTDGKMNDLRKTMEKDSKRVASTALISSSIRERGHRWAASREAEKAAKEMGQKVQDADGLDTQTAGTAQKPGEAAPDEGDESSNLVHRGMIPSQAKQLKRDEEKVEQAVSQSAGEKNKAGKVHETMSAFYILPNELVPSANNGSEPVKNERLPLVQKDIEKLLRKHVQARLDDYEDSFKHSLRITRLAKDDLKSSADQERAKESAYSDMPALRSTLDHPGLSTNTQQFHFLPTSANPGASDEYIPITTYKAVALMPPKYTNYVSLEDNILTKNDGNLKYVPYFSDDFEGKKTSLYKDLEENYKNAINTHKISMPLREKAAGFAPYFEEFMEEAGTRMEDILFYLLDPEHEVPSILPAVSTNAWKNRDLHCKGLFDRAAKKWTLLYSRLYQSPPDDYDRALAGLVCSAFLKLCHFSIWYMASRSPIVHNDDGSALAGISANTRFVSLAIQCKVCNLHECPGHGAYMEEKPSSDDDGSDLDSSCEDGQNYRLRVTSGAPWKPARSLPVYNNKLPAIDYRGLQDDGTIAGHFDNPPSTAAYLSDAELCSDECFWKVSNRKGRQNADSSQWSAKDLEMLTEVYVSWLRFKRGPCMIRNILSGKPCCEIFSRMLDLSTLVDSQTRVQTAPVQKRGWNYWQRNTDTHIWEEREPFRPCSHEGRCQDADCRCYRENITCEPSCGCSDSCDRRYRGCSCERKEGGRICWKNDRCDCFKLGRECDPTLCGDCGVEEVLNPLNRYNEAIGHDHCQNAALQKGVPKRTLMGHSEVMGWGLYAGEDIKANELIGEYKGEVISKAESARRGAVYHYRGLEYLFNLNKTQELDGTRAGNKMRFINHSVRHDNCFSKNLLCNTVQRIGLYAKKDIECGEELFFDYGYPESVTKNFWEKGEKAKDQEQDAAVRKKEKAAKKDSKPLTRRPRRGRGGKGRGGARPGAGRKARNEEGKEANTDSGLTRCENCKDKKQKCVGEPSCRRCILAGVPCVRGSTQRRASKFTLSAPKDHISHVQPGAEDGTDEGDCEPTEEDIKHSGSEEESDIVQEEEASSSEVNPDEFVDEDDDGDQEFEHEESENDTSRRKRCAQRLRAINPSTDRRFGGKSQRRGAETRRKRKLAEMEQAKKHSQSD